MTDDHIPDGVNVSADPIEGGVVMLDAAIAPGEPGHETWRTLTADEKAGRDTERTTAIAQTTQARWAMLRIERNRRLRECDWADVPALRARLAATTGPAWDIYRQALRDVPQVTKDPDEPVWPEPPAAVSEMVPDQPTG